MRTEILTIGNQLVASAANGIYQGIIVVVFVALALRLFGRTNATTRHAVWFCTLLLLVSLVAAHCLIGLIPVSLRDSKTEVATIPKPGLVAFPSSLQVAQNLPGRTTPDSTNSVATFSDRTAGPDTVMEWTDPPLPFTKTAASAAQSNSMRAPEHGKPNSIEFGNATTKGEEPASNHSNQTVGFRWLLERSLNPISLKLALGAKIPTMAGTVLLALWLAIASFKVLALLSQLAGIKNLKRGSISPSAGLNQLFQKLAARHALNRKVELRISPRHQSSFLLGFFHPVILLPAEERLEPTEAELVIRHELAHVQRCDDWANLVQQFLLAMFFFHPAVWWISRQLSLEREIACDDHVLQQSGRPQAYALLLANLAARMQRGLPQLAPGPSNNKTQLRERIDMILNKRRNASPRLAKTWLTFITSAIALIAVAVLCSAPRIVLAQAKAAPAADNAPSADLPPAVLASGIASVAFAPGAPASDSVDAAPQTPRPPAAVGAGAKFKSSSSDLNVPRVYVAAPAAVPSPALAATVAALPAPTPFPAAIETTSQPQSPRAPRPVRAPRPGNRDSSLEERLERLERQVDSLVHQQHPEGGFDFHLKAEKDGMIDRKEIAKIEAFAKRQAESSQKQMINPKEIEKLKEQAERAAARAADQVKRATADVEKAVKADHKRQTDRKLKEGSQRQLEALRKQLEILERQKEKLDRQIEDLEQDQEELDEQQDEDQAGSDTQLDESKEEPVTQSSVAQ